MADLTFSNLIRHVSLRVHQVFRQTGLLRQFDGIGLTYPKSSGPFIYLDKSADFQNDKYHYSVCPSEEIAGNTVGFL